MRKNVLLFVLAQALLVAAACRSVVWDGQGSSTQDSSVDLNKTQPDWIDAHATLGAASATVSHYAGVVDESGVECAAVEVGVTSASKYILKIFGALAGGQFSSLNRVWIQIAFHWVTGTFDVTIRDDDTAALKVQVFGKQLRGSCQTSGAKFLQFGYKLPPGGIWKTLPPVFGSAQAACETQVLTCGNDDSLRKQHVFDSVVPRDVVQSIPIDGWGSWEALVKEMSVGDNVAVGGETSLTLDRGVGVTVLYFKALPAADRPTEDVQGTVTLYGPSWEECATITGTKEGDTWTWTVAGPGSSALSQQAGGSFARVELRTEWDRGTNGTWSLYLTTSGGLNKQADNVKTGMAQTCVRGVQHIVFGGTNIWYDNAMLTCNSEAYSVLDPTSAWGDPHFTDAFGNKFDFMGVPDLPYVLYDDGDLKVFGAVAVCNGAATCLEEVRAVSLLRFEEVVVTATTVTQRQYCEPVAELPWATVTESAGLVTLVLHNSDGEDLLRFVLKSFYMNLGHYLSVYGYPLPALNALGLGGLLFGTTTEWRALRAALQAGGGAQSVPASLVVSQGDEACWCEDDLERGYCSTGRRAQLLADGAAMVISVPTLAEAAAECATSGALTRAMACCERLADIEALAVTHAQCVTDECSLAVGDAACLDSTRTMLAFTDATGPFALQLCAGANVVQDLATLACTVCREGWFPAPADAAAFGIEACTALCLPGTTCGGYPCSARGLCICADGEEHVGPCPLPPTACTTDSDCSADTPFCRAACSGGSAGECRPLVAAGGPCTTASPCTEERCQAGLTCSLLWDGGPQLCLGECGYVGCFFMEQAASTSSATMTPAECAAFCRPQETAGYGVRGTDCTCDNGGPIVYVGEAGCQSRCPGDGGEFCGGTAVSLHVFC